MRLLLFLSAILTALSGAGVGTRALAQPVEASACAPAAAEAVRVVARRHPSSAPQPLAATVAPRLAPAVVAPRPFPLYADRLRE